MAVFNDDHRTVVQIRYALIFFLSSLYDIDFHLLSGNTCRFQRVGQIVDIQDDDALQGSHLIEIVIVRYDLGVDLTSSTDTSVMSVLDGTVTDVYSNNLEGNVVEITHANGFVSTYSSLADGVLVSEGDEVTKGQKIGEASNTAGKEFDDEIALHFMLFKDGVEVDPNDYLDLGLK